MTERLEDTTAATVPQRRRRVVVASRIFDPEPAAAAFRLRAMVTALAGRGADVEVLTVRPPRGLEARSLPGVSVRRWPVLRDRNQYVRGYLPYLSFDLPLFWRLLTTRRPDAVVVEPPPTTGAVVRLVCALRRIPYVAYLPDVWSDGAAGAGAPAPVVRVVRMLERLTLRGAQRVVAVTPEIADRAAALGVERSRVAMVRNGIDTSVFTPDGAPHPEAPTGPYAVYAGTISEWQGAEIFLRVWPQVRDKVPDATLVFLGHGSVSEDLRRMADSLGDDAASVRLLPLVPASEAAAWQRGAAVVLASMRPGQTYDYFLPTKVFAGAAAGTPVLYVGPGPANALVEKEALGAGVEYDDAQVAEALATMLSGPPSPQSRRHLAEWARTNADATRAGSASAEIIDRVAASARRR